MKLAAPLIIAAHVANLPTLDPWSAAAGRAAVPVYEGAALRRDDVSEWCTIGFVAASSEPTLSFEPVAAVQGSQNREQGTILCQLITAQADVATARGRVFDLLGAWAGWLPGDRTMGQGEGGLLGAAVSLSADVTLATTRAGATANAVVTITYDATTYG